MVVHRKVENEHRRTWKPTGQRKVSGAGRRLRESKPLYLPLIRLSFTELGRFGIEWEATAGLDVSIAGQVTDGTLCRYIALREKVGDA